MPSKPAPDPRAAYLVKVPANCRPRLGRGKAIPLQLASERGGTIIADITRDSPDMVKQLLKTMGAIITSSSDPVDIASVERLLAFATDLRGVAGLFGSPITSEIATLIFQLAEQALLAGRVSRPLLRLLVEVNERLLRADDNQRFETEMRALLKLLRSKLALDPNLDPSTAAQPVQDARESGFLLCSSEIF
jgi:hypothetical protein